MEGLTTLDRLLVRLRAYAYRSVTEAGFQADMAAALAREAVPFEAEWQATGADRPDFYLPAWRAALELKVTGGPSGVLRQLLRYAALPEVDVLVLATKRASHRSLPREVGGKPLRVLFLWEGGL